jgi:hypothetical protein
MEAWLVRRLELRGRYAYQQTLQSMCKRYTHVDRLVARGPVIFLASMVEDTKPTKSRKKRSLSLEVTSSSACRIALFFLVQLDPFFALQLLSTIVHDRCRVVPVYHRERATIRRGYSRVFLVRYDTEWHLAVWVHHLRIQDRLLRSGELETDRVPLLGPALSRRRAAPLLLWGSAILALWVRWGTITLLGLSRIVRAWRGGTIAWRSSSGLVSALLLPIGLLVPDLLGLMWGLLLVPTLALRGGIRGRPILLLVS